MNNHIQAQSMMNIFDGEVTISKSSKSKNIFKRAKTGFKKFLSASRQSLAMTDEKDEVYEKKSKSSKYEKTSKSPKNFRKSSNASEVCVEVPHHSGLQSSTLVRNSSAESSTNYQPYGKVLQRFNDGSNLIEIFPGSNRAIGFTLGKIPTVRSKKMKNGFLQNNLGWNFEGF